MALSPSQRSQRARIAALTRWSRSDSVEGTARARSAFLARFVDQVDPERKLPEADRLRRAKHARAAHFARLALQSSKARAAKKAAG